MLFAPKTFVEFARKTRGAKDGAKGIKGCRSGAEINARSTSIRPGHANFTRRTDGASHQVMRICSPGHANARARPTGGQARSREKKNSRDLDWSV